MKSDHWLAVWLLIQALAVTITEAFAPTVGLVPRVTSPSSLGAAPGKKKRRRRKTGTSTTDEVINPTSMDKEEDEEDEYMVSLTTEKDFQVDNEEPTGFEFQPPKADTVLMPPGESKAPVKKLNTKVSINPLTELKIQPSLLCVHNRNDDPSFERHHQEQ
jgi:hypothetical protein